jgi:hypothetical protein
MDTALFVGLALIWAALLGLAAMILIAPHGD